MSRDMQMARRTCEASDTFRLIMERCLPNLSAKKSGPCLATGSADIRVLLERQREDVGFLKLFLCVVVGPEGGPHAGLPLI